MFYRIKIGLLCLIIFSVFLSSLNAKNKLIIDLNKSHNSERFVEIDYFYADFFNEDVKICWATNFEYDNSHWNIWRSTENHFTTAVMINDDSIAGMGTTVEYTEYEYIDSYFDYPILYYYWLENVDNTGQSFVSNSISIDTNDMPLPVTLDAFFVNQGQNYGEFVTISWTVSSETDMFCYKIHRAETEDFNEANEIERVIVEEDHFSLFTYSLNDGDDIQYNNTYYYWLEGVANSGNSAILANGSVIIAGDPFVPSSITKLDCNYPNPFNPTTHIKFFVKEGETAVLKIANSKNQILRSALLYETNIYGAVYNWDGTDATGNIVTSGIYICSLESDSYYGEIELILVNSSGDFEEFTTNYPNPFNPATTIIFSLHESSKVNLSIFNEKGQKVKNLTNKFFDIGTHSFLWDGKDEKGKPACAGNYFYQLKLNGKSKAVKKCLLLK